MDHTNITNRGLAKREWMNLLANLPAATREVQSAGSPRFGQQIPLNY